MRSEAHSRTIQTVEEVRPFGSITLAPKSMTGCSEADLARSMAGAVSERAQDSPAGALAELRDIFPDVPLSLRVKALNLLLGRGA